MKLRPRVKVVFLVTLLGSVFYLSLLGARIIEYSRGSFSDFGSALQNAVKRGDATVVRLLLITGADPNQISQRSGMTLLDRAAERGDLKVARILLDAGAEPNGSVQIFERPLFHAAYSKDREMVDLLMEHGAYYEVVDAVLLGDVEFVEQAMIEDPKMLQDIGSDGRSLLFFPMIWGRLDTTNFLLELGLDPTIEGSGVPGESVLDYARKQGQQDFVELFESYESVSEPDAALVGRP